MVFQVRREEVGSLVVLRRLALWEKRIFKKYLFFREEGWEGEREGEKHHCDWLSLVHAPPGN